MGLGPLLGRGEDLPGVGEEDDPLAGSERPHVDLLPVFLRHGPQVVMLVKLWAEIDLHLGAAQGAQVLIDVGLAGSDPVTRNPIMNVASRILRNPKASAT